MNKKNHKFTKNPNFKYKELIINTNTPYGSNDMFEIYTSLKDNRIYIASPNNVKKVLDIYTLLEHKKIISLKSNEFSGVRYFVNYRNNKEYLVSGERDEDLIIWDITDNYKIKYKKREGGMCILVFTDNNKDYIITNEGTQSYTKIYSFNNCSYISNIKNKKYLQVEYLLPWLNKNDNQYYIIQLTYDGIFINDLLQGKLYANLTNYEYGYYYTGFLYNKDNKDYLCVSSKYDSINNDIEIWDLYNKNLSKVFLLKGYYDITTIMKWNDKYVLICDFHNKCVKVFDFENEKLITIFKDKNCIRCTKKLYHPIYGESILTADESNAIKLWSV